MEGAYTFYSHPHKSYSRLDYFFIPSDCIHYVSSCQIGPIVLSDHGPVYLVIDISILIQKSNYWKFNTSFLSNTSFCAFFRQKIIQYWQDNQNSPVSPAIKWDAAKATLRGHLIAYAALRKKLKIQKRKELEAEVSHLEKQHKRLPNQVNWILLNNAKAKLNLDHTEHTKKLLFYTKQRYYESGYKPSRLLAYQLKKEQSERTIKAIKTSADNMTFDPQDINTSFSDFYRNLYTADYHGSNEDLLNYLNEISLPSISDDARRLLNAPFTKDEIWHASFGLSFPLF